MGNEIIIEIDRAQDSKALGWNLFNFESVYYL
jgi:hypothetical protein